jgi:hypothetical protein
MIMHIMDVFLIPDLAKMLTTWDPTPPTPNTTT